jgi:hypothetical protein
MLRITVHGVADHPVLELEGCVCGPWVDELEMTWRDALTRSKTGRVDVDLRSVCHVDGRGRVLMKAMHSEGAEFIASGFVMPEIVREFART